MEKKKDLRKNNVVAESKAQIESKYDSHSEEKPHQKEIINDNSNPDRVSHNNTDDYLEKLPSHIHKESNAIDDGLNADKTKTNKREWDASFYPKKNT